MRSRRKPWLLLLGTLTGMALWSAAALPVRGEVRQLPREVTPLPVEGFNPAAYVAPDLDTPPPWPLIVILHGNFDRPEWQCETWAAAGRKRGWLLCPRGVPRPDTPPAQDRWTYRGRTRLAAEIRAATTALEKAHPGLVTRDEATLIGFSLGAHMAPHVAGMKVLPFRRLVLAEGGCGATEPMAQRAARRGLQQVVYLCGARTACPYGAKQATRRWRRYRLKTGVVVMPGVGHAYIDPFDATARRVFDLLDEM